MTLRMNTVVYNNTENKHIINAFKPINNITDKCYYTEQENSDIKIVTYEYLINAKYIILNVGANCLEHYISDVLIQLNIKHVKLNLSNKDIPFINNIDNLPKNIVKLDIDYDMFARSFIKTYENTIDYVLHEYPIQKPFELLFNHYVNKLYDLKDISINVNHINKYIYSNNITDVTDEYQRVNDIHASFYFDSIITIIFNLKKLNTIHTNLYTDDHIYISDISWRMFPKACEISYINCEDDKKIVIKRQEDKLAIQDTEKAIIDDYQKVSSVACKLLIQNADEIEKLHEYISLIHKKNNFDDVYDISGLYDGSMIKNRYVIQDTEKAIIAKFRELGCETIELLVKCDNKNKMLQNYVNKLHQYIYTIHKKNDFNDVYDVSGLYVEYPLFEDKEKYNAVLTELHSKYELIVSLYSKNRQIRELTRLIQEMTN